jgi:hypothetical protein
MERVIPRKAAGDRLRPIGSGAESLRITRLSSDLVSARRRNGNLSGPRHTPGLACI